MAATGASPIYQCHESRDFQMGLRFRRPDRPKISAGLLDLTDRNVEC